MARRRADDLPAYVKRAHGRFYFVVIRVARAILRRNSERNEKTPIFRNGRSLVSP